MLGVPCDASGGNKKDRQRRQGLRAAGWGGEACRASEAPKHGSVEKVLEGAARGAYTGWWSQVRRSY